ncbi:MAG: alpha-glucosidase, partial [Ruminococcaceae bacterium]|nr:alpha-glucosidase [Oscillospiraceae bacterium]
MNKNESKPIFSRKTPLRELLKSPVGYDIAERLLNTFGKNATLLNNKIIGGIRLGALPRLSKGMVDEALLDTIINMLNSVEAMGPLRTEGEYLPAWWKEMVVYQIYPRSFCDYDGDGVGDLAGITANLDYLAELGINAIWMSPICDSPNDDNGYDIRDYRKIMAEFGTMEDFRCLLAEAHRRGIRVIMDMVLNHSSDEHEWFQRALAGEKKYQDYYYFVDGEPDTPPNNWLSFFSGSAWNYYPEIGKWALHSFSKKQMDLNWENPELREELFDIMRFWLDEGVDGFRLDVISIISKTKGLPDGSDILGSMLGFRGIEHYFFGPRLHEFLRELRANSFGRYDAFTVGETPGTGMHMNQMLTAEERGELDTVLCFDHLDCPGKNKYDNYLYDLRWMKKVLTAQQIDYTKSCWNVLFFENHDNPRMISKVNPDPAYRDAIGKL